MISDLPHVPDRRERRALLGVLARAFRDNPMNIALHGPRLGRRVRANRAGLRSIVLDSQLPIEMRVLSLNNEVVGGFIAAPPELPVLPAPFLVRQIACFLEQGARAMDGWGELTARLSADRPLIPHWYVSVLGVEPDLHGEGIGATLLASLFERVRASPAPIYLECDRPASVAFYRNHGFEIRGEQSIHGVEIRCLGRGFPDESPDLCDSVRQA